MGDRAVVYVKGAPCAMYVHWSGREADGIVAAAAPVMRVGDDSYATARLIGTAHEHIEGLTGLGVLPAPTDKDAAEGYEKYSHGDAGVLIVDIATGKGQWYAGYQTEKNGGVRQFRITNR